MSRYKWDMVVDLDGYGIYIDYRQKDILSDEELDEAICACKLGDTLFKLELFPEEDSTG